MTFVGAAFTPTPSTCALTYTATLPAALSTRLTFTALTRTFSLTTTLDADVGTHAVVMSAVDYAGTTITSTTKTFNIVIN